MNVTESNYLNKLVRSILDPQAVDDAEALEAAVFLTARACQTLKAGLRPTDVAAQWEQRRTAAAPLPRRDDAVAAWLRETRELYDESSAAWQAVDDLLDDYWVHADYGLPLDALVPEPPHGGERP